MCRQRFVHYKCGHCTIEEAECELASDIPFYLKLACPSYVIETDTPNRCCGVGLFYCKETPQGRLFEAAHQAYIRAVTERNQLWEAANQLNARNAIFNQKADKANVSAEARKLHPGYEALRSARQNIDEEMTKVQEARQQAGIVIQASRNYFKQCQQHTPSLNLIFTLSPDVESKLPAEWQAQLHGLRTRSYLNNTGNPFFPSQNSNASNAGKYQPWQPNHLPAVKYTHAPTRKPDQGTRVFSTLPKTPNVWKEDGEITTLDTQGVSSAPVKRKRRLSAQAQNSPNRAGKTSPDKNSEVPGIRRSARVRGQHKNYAESEESSGFSREPSPVKSDASSFTPFARDLSISPDRNKSQRRRPGSRLKKETSAVADGNVAHSSNNGSLGDLINDWQQRAMGTQAKIARNQPENATNLTPCKPAPIQGPMFPPSRQVSASMREISPPLARLLDRAHAAASLPAQMGRPVQNGRPPDERVTSTPDFHSQVGTHNTAILNQPSVLPESAADNSAQNLYNSYARQTMSAGTANRPYTSLPPDQAQNHQHVKQTWLINAPEFKDLTDTAVAQLQDQTPVSGVGMKRQDSAIGGSMVPTTTADYDRLRRSFSAIEGLLPPSRPDLTSSDTSSTKRKLPASSPLLAPNKRAKMSLPDGSAASSVYSRDLPYDSGGASSPSKMSSWEVIQDENYRQGPQAATGQSTSMSSTSVPAPTAVMHPPSREDEVRKDEQAPPASNYPEGDFEGDSGDGRDSPVSDIVWGFLDDEVV